MMIGMVSRAVVYEGEGSFPLEKLRRGATRQVVAGEGYEKKEEEEEEEASSFTPTRKAVKEV